MAHKVYSCTSTFGFVKPNVNEILQIAQLMFSNFLIGVRGKRTETINPEKFTQKR